MEKQNEELDLRNVERFQRHPLVFAKFDALDVGESFVLINDHDPVPLHGQMEAMRPQQLTWEYIVRGPEIFRIRVSRVATPSGAETSPSGLPQTLWGIKQSH
jgi:uncharacterized protein (DUF2249 family)